MVGAGLLIIVMISAALVSLESLLERQVGVGLQQTSVAWLTLAVLSFGNINTSESAAGGSFPAVVLGAMGWWKALLSFVLRESNKAVIRRPENNYDLLYYILTGQCF
ncbi:hypothetical protein MRX96_037068 [Rhipicephalus microplus]